MMSRRGVIHAARSFSLFLAGIITPKNSLYVRSAKSGRRSPGIWMPSPRSLPGTATLAFR